MYGFCDSDWAADPDTRRSVGAYILMLNGGAIVWHSKLQASVSMSTAEAKFITAVVGTAAVRRLPTQRPWPCGNAEQHQAIRCRRHLFLHHRLHTRISADIVSGGAQDHFQGLRGRGRAFKPTDQSGGPRRKHTRWGHQMHNRPRCTLTPGAPANATPAVGQRDVVSAKGFWAIAHRFCSRNQLTEKPMVRRKRRRTAIFSLRTRRC